MFDVVRVWSAVASIARALGHHARKLGAASAAMRAITRAAMATAPNPHCLTPSHAVAAMLGCDSKHYREVCAMADSDLFEVMPKATGSLVEDVLCYYYYAGVAYAALKKWGKATDAFSMVLVTPSATLSAVSFEAERWRILCSLMATGKAPLPPVAATQGMVRSLAADVRPFTHIAEAFVTMDPKSERRCISPASLFSRSALTFPLPSIAPAPSSRPSLAHGPDRPLLALLPRPPLPTCRSCRVGRRAEGRGGCARRQRPHRPRSAAAPRPEVTAHPRSHQHLRNHHHC